MSQGLPSPTVYHMVDCPSIRSMQVSSFAKLPKVEQDRQPRKKKSRNDWTLALRRSNAKYAMNYRITPDCTDCACVSEEVTIADCLPLHSLAGAVYYSSHLQLPYLDGLRRPVHIKSTPNAYQAASERPSAVR